MARLNRVRSLCGEIVPIRSTKANSKATNIEKSGIRSRSEQMALILSANTKPEKFVRRIVRSLGFRPRSNEASLPGRPDIVLHKLKKVVFVHGCFWHQHRRVSCRLSRLPKSRLDFWGPKFEKNRARDAKVTRILREAGWKVLVVWECELPNESKLTLRIERFLNA